MGLVKEPKEIDFTIHSESWTEEELSDFRKLMADQKAKLNKAATKKEKKPEIEVIRHSLAHVMALALNRLYKKVQFGIGPETETGNTTRAGECRSRRWGRPVFQAGHGRRRRGQRAGRTWRR
jgi:hypothetical protein